MKQFKHATLVSLQSAGFFNALCNSAWRRRRLLILCYHGVSLADEHQWDSSLYMSASQFERRMATLKAGEYSVLPLSEALDRLRAGNLPLRSVALTFDDGTSDFYLLAYPVLKKYGFPATVYLTTYYCVHNRPVFNVFCRYLLWKARNQQVMPDGRLGLQEGTDLSTAAGRLQTMRRIWKLIDRQRLPGRAKDEFLQQLAAHLSLPYDEFIRQRILHIMRPEEVTEIASTGIDVQLHTHRHDVPISEDLFAREIKENRVWIETMTGKSALHFCYPGGKVRKEFLPWLRELGVISATTCAPGLATQACDSLLLPRLVDVSGLSDVAFEGWLTGVSALMLIARRPILPNE